MGNICRINYLLCSYFSGLNLRTYTSSAKCLLNTPEKNQSELFDAETVYPGQIYTPMDQCRMIYGNEATLCKAEIANICSRLSCRANFSSTECIYSSYGSAEGTPCGSGKVLN